MTLEELIADVAKRGLVIRQWHQRVSHPTITATPSVAIGGWWCELMHPGGWRDSDQGNTAQEALANALERAAGKKGHEGRPAHIESANISEETKEKLRNAPAGAVIEVTQDEMQELKSKGRVIQLDMTPHLLAGDPDVPKELSEKVNLNFLD